MNPELQRQLWLRITPGRLLAMPGLLGLIFALVFLLNEGHSSEELYVTALIAFFALLYFWGAKQCSDSLRQEVIENTWEAQRMSVLSPWSMLWGKWLGSTALSWYGGLLIIAVLLGTTGIAGPGELQDFPATPKVIVLLVLGALMVQAFSLLLRLHIVRTLGSRPGYDAIYFLLIIYAIGMIATGLANDSKPVHWYGFELSHLDFLVASLLFWLPWVLFGGYRLMRAELSERNGPFAWPLFLTTLCVYLAGLLRGEGADGRLFVSLIVLLVIGYTLLISDRREPLELRRLHHAWQRRDWGDFGERLPLWVSNLLLATLCAVALLPAIGSQLADGSSPTPWALSLVLFVLRDALIMHAISYSPRRLRPDLSIGLTLFTLYLLLPLLVQASGGEESVWLVLFWPIPTHDTPWLLLAPLLEVGVALVWLAGRVGRLGLFTPRA